MKVEGTFLNSRVGRRIFFYFLLSAILPVSVIGIVGFFQVTSELGEQSRDRLHHACKNAGMSIAQRLKFAADEASALAANLRHGNTIGVLGFWEDRFEVSFMTSSKTVIADLTGENRVITEEEKSHLYKGGYLLGVQTGEEGIRILIAAPLDRSDLDRGFLVNEPGLKFLFGEEAKYQIGVDSSFCVLDSSGKKIYATSNLSEYHLDQIRRRISEHAVGQFEWGVKDDRFRAAVWSIPMYFHFHVPEWRVIQSEPRSAVLAPMQQFQRTFPLLLLLSILIVGFFSTQQIRKNLVPLGLLQSGTQAVARGEFSVRVDLQSRDEFEELASDFNRMAEDLEKQFGTLATIGEIDRAILSSLDTREIIETVLKRIPDILPVDQVRFVLVSDRDGELVVYSSESDRDLELERIRTGDELLDIKASIKEKSDLVVQWVFERTGRIAGLHYTKIPSVAGEQLLGVLILGVKAELNRQEKERAANFSNQLAVAISNARLLEDLDQLNWGTLTALARAVDAKSSWTAGHSERVAQISVRIGQEFGLEAKKLETLRRGALLHDLGKIGIPSSVLDKPGELSQQEYRLIQEHSIIGARILEPIGTFWDVLPIVRNHHERYDGNGYPDGLKGSRIPFLVRILTVADAFDAMVSDRPYRRCVRWLEAIETLKVYGGIQFDPEVVQVFAYLVDSCPQDLGIRDERNTGQDFIPLNTQLRRSSDASL